MRYANPLELRGQELRCVAGMLVSHVRLSREMGYLSACSRHVEDRRSRITLFAIVTVPATMHMLFADVILTAE